jgi:hypothetical protein
MASLCFVEFVAQTATFAVRVFSLAIIPAVSYSTPGVEAAASLSLEAIFLYYGAAAQTPPDSRFSPCPSFPKVV